MNHLLPAYEQVVTNEWFEAAMASGLWDPHHGTEVERLVDDIIYGVVGSCPASCENLAASEAFDHPDMKEAIWSYLRDRFHNCVIPKFQKDREELNVGRLMYVDRDWLEDLREGKATVGNYWGFPLDEDANYWMSEKDGQVLALIRASVPASSVDWVATLRQRMDYTIGDDESEIRTLPNSHVKLISVEIGDHIIHFNGMPVSTGEFWPHPHAESAPTIGMAF